MQESSASLASRLLGSTGYLRRPRKILINNSLSVRLSSRCLLLMTLLLITCTLACGPRSAPKESYYWMMSEPTPEGAITIWISHPGEHEKTCDQEKWTPALALATVYTVIQDVNAHKIHYHVRDDEQKGLIFQEYLRDETARIGERRLGRDEAVHFHGLYIDLETAKELIAAVKSHQHGAE